MGVETSCDRIVRAYTINNARITFEEELKGSIEPGKLADLVVLSADYLTVPESEIQRLAAHPVGSRYAFLVEQRDMLAGLAELSIGATDLAVAHLRRSVAIDTSDSR